MAYIDNIPEGMKNLLEKLNKLSKENDCEFFTQEKDNTIRIAIVEKDSKEPVIDETLDCQTGVNFECDFHCFMTDAFKALEDYKKDQ